MAKQAQKPAASRRTPIRNFRGVIRKGKVATDGPLGLPDGTQVVIRAVGAQRRKTSARAVGARPAKPKPLPTLAETFKGLIGIAEGLPSDLSINHDHYLYGTPKRH